MEITTKDFYNIAGVSQHDEFEKYLKDILFHKETRENFYRKMLEKNTDVSHDSFRKYFEEYSAERKSHGQDYTPNEVSDLLSTLTDSGNNLNNKYNGYDACAGTGTLIISKWWHDMVQETPFTYSPHNYFYICEEIADNAIPYLLHNLALRGMNCIVIHGDVLDRKVKQIYFVQNSKDNFLGFSDINVMPHNDTVKSEFSVNKWIEKPINHIESKEIKYEPSIMEELTMVKNKMKGVK